MKPSALQHAHPPFVSSRQVYGRLAGLIGIPLSRLEPLVSTLNESGKKGFYYPGAHKAFVTECKGKDSILEHERLHGIPHLLGGSGGRDAKEIYADAGLAASVRERFGLASRSAAIAATAVTAASALSANKLFALASWVAGCFQPLLSAQLSFASATVVIGLAALPVMAVLASLLSLPRRIGRSKAIRKYGVDGYIALCATKLKTVGAVAFLEKLEAKGLITPQGFTEEGEKWIASLKPRIERLLRIAGFVRSFIKADFDVYNQLLLARQRKRLT